MNSATPGLGGFVDFATDDMLDGGQAQVTRCFQPDVLRNIAELSRALAASIGVEFRFAWKQPRNQVSFAALVKSLVWLVPLAASVVLAHGCLNPQPTAPARDEAGGSDGATATTEAAEGASTTTSPGSGDTATSGGIHSGTGGTASGAPNDGDAGAGGAAGATGSDQGGAPPDHD